MRLPTVLLCLAVSAVALPAQTPAEPRVRIEFSSVTGGQPINGLAFTSDGRRHTHDVPAYRRGVMADYAGPATMEFTEPLPADAPPDAEPRVARVVIPPDTPRVLLLWSRAADGALTAQALPEDTSAFPAGQARLYNASDYHVAVKTRGEIIRLEPGEFTERGGDGKRFILQIAYQYEDDGKWRSAGNNVFALNAETRRTIFFVSSQSDHFKLVNSSGASFTAGVQMFSIED